MKVSYYVSAQNIITGLTMCIAPYKILLRGYFCTTRSVLAQRTSPLDRCTCPPAIQSCPRWSCPHSYLCLTHHCITVVYLTVSSYSPPLSYCSLPHPHHHLSYNDQSVCSFPLQIYSHTSPHYLVLSVNKVFSPSSIPSVLVPKSVPTSLYFLFLVLGPLRGEGVSISDPLFSPPSPLGLLVRAFQQSLLGRCHSGSQLVAMT